MRLIRVEIRDILRLFWRDIRIGPCEAQCARPGGTASGERGLMKSRHNIGLAFMMAVGLGVAAMAQAPARRDFDAEYEAAVRAAKDAAGFEFLGTLVRTCVLPQSGGENTSDNVPDFVATPSKAPA